MKTASKKLDLILNKKIHKLDFCIALYAYYGSLLTKTRQDIYWPRSKETNPSFNFVIIHWVNTNMRDHKTRAFYVFVFVCVYMCVFMCMSVLVLVRHKSWKNLNVRILKQELAVFFFYKIHTNFLLCKLIDLLIAIFLSASSKIMSCTMVWDIIGKYIM